MVNSFIAQADLGTEMTVVRNELETGRTTPASVLFEKTLATMYQWHNYGKSHHRRARRCGGRRHRAPAGLLPHLVPARQRHAHQQYVMFYDLFVQVPCACTRIILYQQQSSMIKGRASVLSQILCFVYVHELNLNVFTSPNF
jgi:hypothetical protein